MTDTALENNRHLKFGWGAAIGHRVSERSAEDPGGPAQGDLVGRRLAFGLLLLVLGVAFLLHLGMVSSDRFGGYYDDTIYVTAAKSLATGEGYRIISLPQPVAQTVIPPFYPFVLSIIWRAYPRFPENLVWMMLFSVIAMMGFVSLAWRYLVKNSYATRWQALGVVTLTAINWRMMSLATSIISETLFALLSVAALHLAEKYEDERSTWRTGALLGLIAGLAFLTRTSGLVLLAAVAMYYFYRRRWRKVLVPVSVGVLFVVGWFGWCYLNQNTVNGEHASYYAGYARGISDTVSRLQTLNDESRLMVHLKIIETNALGLILVWAPLQMLGLRATLSTPLLVPLILLVLTFLVAGFVRETRKGIRLLEIYLLLYLGLHLVVPSHSYERYVMPIVPFLLFFLVRELSALFSTLRQAVTSSEQAVAKTSAVLVGLVLLTPAGVAVYSNWTGIYHTLTPAKESLDSGEDAQAINWIKANTDPSSILVCFGDQKYYLYTDRKAVRSIPVNILDVTVYQEREPDRDEYATVFLNIAGENRANYLVLNAADFEGQAPAYGKNINAYVKEHPDEFVLVFESHEGRSRIYCIQDKAG